MSISYKSDKKKPTRVQKQEQPVSDLLLQRIFDYGPDASIISIVGDGQIIRANQSACKLSGYSVTELLTMSIKDIFGVSENGYKHLFQEPEVNNPNKGELSIRQRNGNFVRCEITTFIIEHINGNENYSTAIMVPCKDKPDDKLQLSNIENRTAEKLKAIQLANNEWMSSIVKISYDLICDWDLTDNQICFGSNYSEIFGYKLPKNKIDFEAWIALFQPSERDIIKAKLNAILQSESLNWEYTFKFICPDGSVSEVISRANIIRDTDGKAIRMIGIIHDITKQQKLELSLAREVTIKEKQIVEAIVEAKEMERSDLGKELHDNVNQLLAASMLYLDMARKDIQNGEIYLRHSSEYTYNAIEEIRKLTRGLMGDTIQELGFNGAIGRIINDTMEVDALKIHLKLDPSLEDLMSEKFKLNIFRIIQEQLNNILKHARATDAYINFSKTISDLILSVTDNGVGFDSSQRSKGIGLNNIISRSKLYKGKPEIISKPGNGCKLMIKFPLLAIY